MKRIICWAFGCETYVHAVEPVGSLALSPYVDVHTRCLRCDSRRSVLMRMRVPVAHPRPCDDQPKGAA